MLKFWNYKFLFHLRGERSTYHQNARATLDLPSNQLILVLQLGQNLKVDITILELQVFYFSSEEQSTFTSRMPIMRRSEQFILDLTSNHPSWFLCECKMVFFLLHWQNCFVNNYGRGCSYEESLQASVNIRIISYSPLGLLFLG